MSAYGFEYVTLVKESPSEATIQFKLGGGNLKKEAQPLVSVTGNNKLRVEMTLDGRMYAKDINGLDIKESTKVKVDKTTIDVTVAKNSQFDMADKI